MNGRLANYDYKNKEHLCEKCKFGNVEGKCNFDGESNGPQLRPVNVCDAFVKRD